MRAVFGMLGLVVVIALISLLAKSQLTANRQAVMVLPGAASAVATDASTTLKAQSQQLQQQYKQALDAVLQTPRPLPEPEKP